jgi:hypothetical protein
VQGIANAAYLEGFLFCGVLRVAPYCVPDGIRVVSISPFLQHCEDWETEDRKYGLSHLCRLCKRANIEEKARLPQNPRIRRDERLTWHYQSTTRGVRYSTISFTIEEQVAEGDTIVTKYRQSGVSRGEFMGVPPSGEEDTGEDIYIHRISGGKITKEWGIWQYPLRFFEFLFT